mgnify:CR=1 FL=1
MAGMKIRCIAINDLTLSEAKGAICGILLLLLAFAVPRLDFAEENPVNAKALQQQSNPVAPLKTMATANLSKEATGSITDVRIAPEAGQLTVAVATDRAIVPKEIILDNPPRLVLDFPNTENKVRFSKLPVLSAAVKQVRVQQFQSSPAPIARVVCDLEKSYGSHEINLEKSQVRLVFRDSAPKLPDAASLPKVKPAPSQPQNASKPKTPEAQPVQVAVPVQPKAESNGQKSRPAAAASIPTAVAPAPPARRPEPVRPRQPGRPQR